MLDTLSNVKTRLGITGTTNDTFLTAQITLVSDCIEAYCRRVFKAGSYTQTFYRGDYVTSRMMELFHYPISAVASVVEDGVTLSSTAYRLHKPTGRLIRPTTALNVSFPGVFFYADETVVTYTAGSDTIPTPVLAVLDAVVQERYTKQTSGVNLNFGSDVQRISIPGAISIDFDYTLTNNDRTTPFGVILGNNLNMLDNYRSERAILGSGKLIYLG